MRLSLSTSVNLHKLFFSVTQKLFKLFVPVLIYQNTHSINFAILFLLLEQILRVTFTLCVRNFAYKIPTFLVAVSIIPFIILQVLFVINIQYVFWVIFLLALLSALSSSIYWPAINLIFVSSTSNKEFEKHVSKFEISSSLGKMIAPLVGALLIYYNLLWVNIVICCLLYAFAIIFILLKHNEITFNISKIASTEPNINISKNYKKTLLVFYVLNGLRDFAIDQVLPLFLTIMAINIKLIGWSYLTLEIGVILSHILTIFLYRKGNWFLTGVISACALGVWLIAFPFVISPTMVIIFTIFVGLLNPLCYNAMFTKFVEQKDRSILKNMVDREVSIIGAKVVPSALLFVLPISCWFLLGGVAYLLYTIPYTIIKKQSSNNSDVEKLNKLNE